MYAQLLWIGLVGWAVNRVLVWLDRRYLVRFGGMKAATP
jgi:hypothetical protein